MINISKIYANHSTTGDPLRYGKNGPANVKHSHHFKNHSKPKSASERRPVVVWNITKQCNLKCVHCYASSNASTAPDELTSDEGKMLIDDLASYRIPALLISGGEPTLRKDLFELVDE